MGHRGEDLPNGLDRRVLLGQFEDLPHGLDRRVLLGQFEGLPNGLDRRVLLGQFEGLPNGLDRRVRLRRNRDADVLGAELLAKGPQSGLVERLCAPIIQAVVRRVEEMSGVFFQDMFAKNAIENILAEHASG